MGDYGYIEIDATLQKGDAVDNRKSAGGVTYKMEVDGYIEFNMANKNRDYNSSFIYDYPYTEQNPSPTEHNYEILKRPLPMPPSSNCTEVYEHPVSSKK